MNSFTTIDRCRVCRSKFLTSVLNLGEPVLSDFLVSGQPDPERVPLDLLICDDCNLVQLRDTTDPALLYLKSYWYRSGVNPLMKDELADVVRKAMLMVGGIDKGDIVIDIGANDGTLLQQYVSNGSTPCRVAYEPAQSLNETLRPHADLLVAELFPNDISAAAPNRSAKIITSIAVFNHVPDPLQFVQGIDYLLADDGLWIMQVQDLAQQTERTAYDNICHEHVAYYSTETFQALLEPFDLTLVAVERRTINGGSLRFYVRRPQTINSKWFGTVFAQRQSEQWLDREALARFVARVHRHREQLVGTIDHFRERGCTVDLYAASTKSSTLLQYCGIDATRIRLAVERTPEKWGRVTSGTRIPIFSEEAWRADPAPVLLIGAWQFSSYFKVREAAFLMKGGRMLIPLPQTEIVEQRREAV